MLRWPFSGKQAAPDRKKLVTRIGFVWNRLSCEEGPGDRAKKATSEEECPGSRGVTTDWADQ